MPLSNDSFNVADASIVVGVVVLSKNATAAGVPLLFGQNVFAQNKLEVGDGAAEITTAAMIPTETFSAESRAMQKFPNGGRPASLTSQRLCPNEVGMYRRDHHCGLNGVDSAIKQICPIMPRFRAESDR